MDIVPAATDGMHGVESKMHTMSAIRRARRKHWDFCARRAAAVRGFVSLLDADGALRIEASDGIADAARTVDSRVGEGITGRVVQTAKPIVVPRVSKEPDFLHRAARRPELPHQELSFICTPIVL